MSAFGRRGGGAGGGRPAGFGVARPMQGGGPDEAPQFPPIEPTPAPVDPATAAVEAPGTADAMARLASREAASADAGSSRGEGFEASVHKIKEQVLPRACLEPG